MKIAIIGYGKMGREIEHVAKERGHKITCAIDIDSICDFQSDAFRQSDAAIEFTCPETAADNILRCFDAGIPVVCGTTGWMNRLEEIRNVCLSQNQSLFFGTNFSLGVNIFFSISQQLARIMNRFNEYDVTIDETHHTQKLDAPSGTAITLAQGIMHEMKRKKQWMNDDSSENPKPDDIMIRSIRKNNIPGIHTIHYSSSVDDILLTHSAKNRRGFAIGAALAAEFIKDKKGVFGMNDLLNF